MVRLKTSKLAEDADVHNGVEFKFKREIHTRVAVQGAKVWNCEKAKDDFSYQVEILSLKPMGKGGVCVGIATVDFPVAETKLGDFTNSYGYENDGMIYYTDQKFNKVEGGDSFGVNQAITVKLDKTGKLSFWLGGKQNGETLEVAKNVDFYPTVSVDYECHLKFKFDDKFEIPRNTLSFFAVGSISSPQLNGKKKAVVIGCNYTGSEVALSACVRDAHFLKSFLQLKFEFPKDSIKLLTDDQLDQSCIPTRQNILKAIQWLIGDASAGDSLWFSFSGHGGFKDLTYICPLDYLTKAINSDDLYSELSTKIPKDCKLTCLMDCCHSGNLMGLPHLYKNGKWTKASNNKADGDVVCISGCKAHETSAESLPWDSGVLTHFFTEIFTNNPKPTYQSLFELVTGRVSNNQFTQSIQMSSSKNMIEHNEFII